MLKKSLLFFALLFVIPVYAEYQPLSDEPITSPEEFEQMQNTEDETRETPEFEYPAQTPEPVDVKPVKNYAEIYNNLQPADFSYQHDIDPEQYYDIKDASWSPYPLLRLNSYLYFKNIAIEPGYYLLTPREHEGKWYILFKQNGRVNYIIPVYERDITPEFFYDEHIPKPKLTWGQKVHMGFLDFLGNFKSTKRKTPVQSYMEINDLENFFVSIIIYYGSHKYYTIFRSIRL